MSPRVPSERRKVPTSIALPGELLDRIDAAATAQQRTRSWIIQRAIHGYLAGLNEHLHEYGDPAGIGQIASRRAGAHHSTTAPEALTPELVEQLHAERSGQPAPSDIPAPGFDPDAAAAQKLEDAEPQEPCTHQRTSREKAASGGFRKVCLDCGEVVLR